MTEQCCICPVCGCPASPFTIPQFIPLWAFVNAVKLGLDTWTYDPCETTYRAIFGRPEPKQE